MLENKILVGLSNCNLHSKRLVNGGFTLILNESPLIVVPLIQLYLLISTIISDDKLIDFHNITNRMDKTDNEENQENETIKYHF